MRVALRIVESRCAMTNVVRPAMAASSARFTFASVAASSAEVASSRMRMGGALSSARAMDRRWRSPPDSDRPRSATTVSSPLGWRMMTSVAWARASAAATSRSVASGRPTRTFSRIVRAKSIGSWNTMPMFRRSDSSVIARTSTPSMSTRPDCGSNAR